MENNKVTTHEQANGLNSHAGSASGPVHGRTPEVTLLKTPQFAGTMGTARPADPRSTALRLRSYYNGSLC